MIDIMDSMIKSPQEILDNRTTNDIGKHSELLAQTALLSAGFQVMEPISPQAYDMVAKRPDEKSVSYIQVKTAFLRDEERYGGKYLVVKGAKNSGKTYTKDEVDFFIAVWDNKCYMIENREITEYWVRPEKVLDKWVELSTSIK